MLSQRVIVQPHGCPQTMKENHATYTRENMFDVKPCMRHFRRNTDGKWPLWTPPLKCVHPAFFVYRSFFQRRPHRTSFRNRRNRREHHVGGWGVPSFVMHKASLLEKRMPSYTNPRYSSMGKTYHRDDPTPLDRYDHLRRHLFH